MAFNLEEGHSEKQNIRQGKNKFYRNYKCKETLIVVYEERKIFK